MSESNADRERRADEVLAYLGAEPVDAAREAAKWRERAERAEAALKEVRHTLVAIEAQGSATYWHKKVLKWCAREAEVALRNLDDALSSRPSGGRERAS